MFSLFRRDCRALPAMTRESGIIPNSSKKDPARFLKRGLSPFLYHYEILGDSFALPGTGLAIP